METEKRNLQIDLETARYIYRINKPSDPNKPSIYGNIFLGLIKGAFTVEELEGDYITKQSFKTLSEQDKNTDDYLYQQSMGFRKDQEFNSSKEEVKEMIKEGINSGKYKQEGDKIFKKNVPFSLDFAKELWANIKDIDAKNVMLKYYTIDQLKGEPEKKGFSWEESYEPDGYYIKGEAPRNEIVQVVNKNKHNHFKHIFKSEKQAYSALAFSQLSHICAKSNEGKTRDKPHSYYTIITCTPGLVALQVKEVSSSECPHLYFYTKKDAENSLRTNYDLWDQYWIVPE